MNEDELLAIATELSAAAYHSYLNPNFNRTGLSIEAEAAGIRSYDAFERGDIPQQAVGWAICPPNSAQTHRRRLSHQRRHPGPYMRAAGLSELALEKRDAARIELLYSSLITGQTSFTRGDDATGTVADALLVSETMGYCIEEVAGNASTRKCVMNFSLSQEKAMSKHSVGFCDD